MVFFNPIVLPAYIGLLEKTWNELKWTLVAVNHQQLLFLTVGSKSCKMWFMIKRAHRLVEARKMA